MPTTEIGLQMYEDRKGCCKETKDMTECYKNNCTVTELNHDVVAHPLSFKLIIVGNAFEFKFAEYVLEGTHFTSITETNHVGWMQNVNGGENISNTSETLSVLEIPNLDSPTQNDFAASPTQNDFAAFKNDVSDVECGGLHDILDGVSYDNTTFGFNCLHGASALCKCIMDIGQSDKTREFKGSKYTLRFTGVKSNPLGSNEGMTYEIVDNRRRRRLLTGHKAWC